jgi:hypothetical protein
MVMEVECAWQADRKRTIPAKKIQRMDFMRLFYPIYPAMIVSHGLPVSKENPIK